MKSILLLSPLVLACAATLPAAAPAPAVVRIEAETAFVVVADGGENSKIGVADAETDSGQSVKLYDVDDAIQVRFSASSGGRYLITARVRTGGAEEPLGFWPDGYRFKLDGKTIVLTGDDATRSSLDSAYGGCFWGTMSAGDVELAAGEHTLEVAANATWAVVDFFEVKTVAAETTGRMDLAVGDRNALASQVAPLIPPRIERTEAEGTITIINDTGSNGTIGVADAELDSGQSVQLYDKGDAVRISLMVSRAGEYRLEARVRSGGSTGPTSFWPEGYRAHWDGKPLSLAGKAESVSGRDPSYGGCFWGTMQSDILTLNAGAHAVEIAAATDWGVLDYVQLVAVEPANGVAVPTRPTLTTTR